MKIHLRIIALVLVLLLSVSSLATAEEIPEKNTRQSDLEMRLTVEEIRITLENVFETMTNELQKEGLQLWYSIFFNEKLELFFIEFAIDGFAEIVFAAIDAGYDESYEAWLTMKEIVTKLYDGLSTLLGMCENENLKLVLELQNDTLFFQDEWDIPYFDGLYQITNGYVTWDVMKVEKAPMPTRGPAVVY